MSAANDLTLSVNRTIESAKTQFLEIELNKIILYSSKTVLNKIILHSIKIILNKITLHSDTILKKLYYTVVNIYDTVVKVY